MVWIKTQVDRSGLRWAKNQYRSCQMQFLGQQGSLSTRGLESARRGDSTGIPRRSPLYPNEAEGGSPYGGVGLISLIHETREIGDGGGGSASLCGEEVAWRLRAPAATA
jgi:hypothetical protein